MATLEETLSANGVATLEELTAKIAKDTADRIEKEKADAEALLKKQIKDLEEIKAKQGEKIGLLQKATELSKEKELLMSDGTKKPDDAPADVTVEEKTEAQWKAENDAIEASLDENAWNVLDNTLKSATPEVRKLATTSEEGRAAFLKTVLGTTVQPPAQETFRRPVQEKKLSVEEQIAIGLGKLKPATTPTLRSVGSGFDPNRKQTDNNNFQPAWSNSGSIRDRLAESKGR